MDGYRIELADCEATLLAEIADPVFKRRDVAVTYGMAIRSSECRRVDWAKVNSAIVARWSRSALDYIKRLAHGPYPFPEPRRRKRA